MKLHEQVKALTEKNEILEQGYFSLLKYISSEKFQVDNMVNNSDIELRIMEIKNEANKIETK